MSPGNDGAQRLAVAHALGGRDDVRNDALLFETPEMMTQAAIADLNFVGDAQATAFTDAGIDLLEVAGR